MGTNTLKNRDASLTKTHYIIMCLVHVDCVIMEMLCSAVNCVDHNQCTLKIPMCLRSLVLK